MARFFYNYLLNCKVRKLLNSRSYDGSSLKYYYEKTLACWRFQKADSYFRHYIDAAIYSRKSILSSCSLCVGNPWPSGSYKIFFSVSRVGMDWWRLEMEKRPVCMDRWLLGAFQAKQIVCSRTMAQPSKGRLQVAQRTLEINFKFRVKFEYCGTVFL